MVPMVVPGVMASAATVTVATTVVVVRMVMADMMPSVTAPAGATRCKRIGIAHRGIPLR